MVDSVDPRVDAYIDALPDWQQSICREVRDLVHAEDHPTRWFQPAGSAVPPGFCPRWGLSGLTPPSQVTSTKSGSGTRAVGLTR